MAVRHRLYGLNGSPYSVKMRAILRYRRIPFDWVQMFAQTRADEFDVRPVLLPVVEFPDGRQMVDTTRVAQLMEAEDGGARSIYPDDAGDRFLALLIEDFADEWLTKPLFWYRWSREPDIAHATGWLARDGATSFADGPLTGDALNDFGQQIQARQIGRMEFVGCTAENTPLVEGSYDALLDAMEPIAEQALCLFGSRPSVADFALYGMLRQLAIDPTPRDVLQKRLPSLRDWIDRVDDMSGIDGAWQADLPAAAAAVRALLVVSGRIYAPFLLANEAAHNAGQPAFAAEIAGHAYRQGTFPYQVKCLTVLRQAWGDLDDGARASLTPILDETGWLAALVPYD
jgi:glutathione S-transferase